MLSVEECERYLRSRKLSKKAISEIRDYLYAICKEIIDDNFNSYEKQSFSARVTKGEFIVENES